MRIGKGSKGEAEVDRDENLVRENEMEEMWSKLEPFARPDG
jgi:hypothetical protein